MEKYPDDKKVEYKACKLIRRSVIADNDQPLIELAKEVFTFAEKN